MPLQIKKRARIYAVRASQLAEIGTFLRYITSRRTKFNKANCDCPNNCQRISGEPVNNKANGKSEH